MLQILLHGLRREEICSLTIADYQNKSLLITDAKHGSDRVVPLLDEAVEALERYLIERRGTIADNDNLFLSRLNREFAPALSPDGLYYICKRWGFNPHRCRHTFCSYLVEKGMDSLLAMQLTGHKSTSSFKRYSDRALANKAAEAFRNL